jgi:ribonuclease Y
MEVAISILIGLVMFAAGFAARMFMGRKQLASAELKTKQLVDEATRQAEAIRKQAQIDAKELQHTIRQEFDEKTKSRQQELQAQEKRLHQREEMLDRKLEQLDRKDKELGDRLKQMTAREQAYQSKEDHLDSLIAEGTEQLKHLSSLTTEQAKELVLQRIETECRDEAGMVIKRIDEQLRKDAQTTARGILLEAMKRCASEFTVETTTAVVHLPNEDMKGRIIGREGRNIRAFEQATGVDLIVDDTPDVVTLSSFDMMRREIARASLERLMSDGRIHPARIEEVVERIKKDFDESIVKDGERVLSELNVTNVHPEMVKLLGRLKFRTSYGQNVLMHLKEAAQLAGLIAGELGLDQRLARRCTVFHDIGKAVSHEMEGPHALIGSQLAKRYGECPEVCHSIEAHHEDVQPANIYAVLCIVADSMSGSRPGARGDTLEAYVKRLQTLESICDSFKGVEKAFAIQAGREVRVIVQPDKITDLEAIALAREIKKKVETSIEFPGQIKITVVREIRAIEYAR